MGGPSLLPYLGSLGTGVMKGVLGAGLSSASVFGSWQATTAGLTPEGLERQVREGVINSKGNDYELGQFSRQIRDIGMSLTDFRTKVQQVSTGLGTSVAEHTRFMTSSMRELQGFTDSISASTRVVRSQVSAGDTIASARMTGMNLNQYGQVVDALRGSGLVGTFGRGQGYGATEIGFNRNFGAAIGQGQFGALRDQALQNAASSALGQVASGGRNISIGNAIDTQTSIFQASLGMGQLNNQRDASMIGFGTQAIQKFDASLVSRGAIGSTQLPGMMVAGYDSARQGLLQRTNSELESVEKQLQGPFLNNAEDQAAKEELEARKSKLIDQQKTYSASTSPMSINRALRGGDPNLRNEMIATMVKSFTGKDDKGIIDDSLENDMVYGIVAQQMGVETGAAGVEQILKARAATNSPEAQRARQRTLNNNLNQFTSVFESNDTNPQEQREKGMQLQKSLIPILSSSNEGKAFDEELAGWVNSQGIFKNQKVQDELITQLGAVRGALAGKDENTIRQAQAGKIHEFIRSRVIDPSGNQRTGTDQDIFSDRVGKNQLTSPMVEGGELTRANEMLGSAITSITSTFQTGADSLSSAIAKLYTAISLGQPIDKPLASLAGAAVNTAITGPIILGKGITDAASAGIGNLVNPAKAISDIAAAAIGGGAKAFDAGTLPQARTAMIVPPIEARAFGGPVYRGMRASMQTGEALVSQDNSWGMTSTLDQEHPFIPQYDSYVVSAKDLKDSMNKVPLQSNEVDFVNRHPEGIEFFKERAMQASAASGKYGPGTVDPRLLFALMKEESHFDVNAENPASSATGLFQILAPSKSKEDRNPFHNPVFSADIAGKMIAEKINMFDKVTYDENGNEQLIRSTVYNQGMIAGKQRSFDVIDKTLLLWHGSYAKSGTPGFSDNNPESTLDWLDRVREAYALEGGKPRDFTGTSVTKNDLYVISDLAQKAAGGEVLGRSPVIVGEKGPEVYVPGGNGRILPNDFLNGLNNDRGQSQQSISHKMTIEFVNSSGDSLGSTEVDLMAAISHYAILNPSKQIVRAT